MTVYNEKIKKLVNNYNSDIEHGLTNEQVKENKRQYGDNNLTQSKQKTIFMMIVKELSNFLNILLIIAALISIWASGNLSDGLFIIAIVILNISLSVFQEKKASNAVNALKSMSSPKASVYRNGTLTEINSNELVVGDIIEVQAGDYMPADVRYIETTNLKVDESALTGESVPVNKDADANLEDKTPVADRLTMGHMNTIVTYGRAKAIVTQVGMDTEIGKIADLLNKVEDEETPLQKKIDSLGKLLGTISVIVVIVIFFVGWLYEFELLELFLVSVSLAVAAIPEGLPTVITVVMSMGMRKMAKRKAIVKELSAVETLGSTTVISTDKTGTLTQNKMVVTRIFDNNKVHEVTGKGYEYQGEIKGSNDNIDKIALIGGLCNDAKITQDNHIGDPTELALVTLTGKHKHTKDELNEMYPRIDEYPFDSDRKLMSTLHQRDDKKFLYTKGAPDQLLNVCSHYELNGEIKEIDEAYKQVIKLANQGMAHNALRVLGFAYKEISEYDDITQEENDLIYVGLVGIIDPPRDEVKDAIKICKKAGIRVVMITGDHKLTASAIGKELGIIKDEKNALSGEEIDLLSHEDFLEKVKKTNVFARVSPSHKVAIVKAFQEVGEITSMTGDGVNDAPALKQANIGVAMGIAGTDVSKEAADMVLMDDNFTTIVDAVEEGRVIYSNIRKFVGYLVSCNVGEVLLIFVAMLLGWGSPLLPIQILWINLVTDSFPAFALGLEGKEEGIMDRPPINPKAPIVDKLMSITIGTQAIFLTIAVLFSYYIGEFVLGTHENMGSTLAFITIISGELLRTYSARSETKTLFELKVFENKLVNYSTLVGIFLLCFVLFVPGVNDLFHTNVNLPLPYFFMALLLGFLPLIGAELQKIIKRRL
ncbi:MAG: calcium-translocating P-type ATPase, PMCA-type [Candidatus Izimaplasma sp.]|nr:calcium-translocating P-type ATPase, PMCA-type [Candidatus Izimaplasma bacterium]